MKKNIISIISNLKGLRPHSLFGVALVIGFMSVFTPFRIISFVILVLLAAGSIVSKHVGIIAKSILCFIFITCLLQAVGLVFWKLNMQLTFFWAIAPFYVALTIYAIKFRSDITFKISTNRTEIVAVAFAIISTGMILFTSLSGGPRLQQSIRYISRGYDNATHLSIVNILYENQGYVYGSSAANAKAKGITSYPQGWHLVNSILWHGLPFELGIQNTARTLLVYLVTTLVWYFIMLFSLLYVILFMASYVLKRSLSFNETLAAIGSVSLLQLTTLLPLLSSGFSNYIAVTSYICVLILVLFLYYSGVLKTKLYLLLVAALTIGLSFTWVLIAPFGYILLLAPLFSNKASFKNGLAYLQKNYVFTVMTAFLSLCGVVQGVIQLKYGEGIEALSIYGQIKSVSNSLLITAFAVFLISIFSRTSRIFQSTARLAVSSIASIVGAVYLYQYHTTSTTGYYTEKIVALLLVTICIFAITFFAISLNKLSSKQSGLSTLFCVLGILSALPIVLGMDTSETRYAMGGRDLSAYSASQMANLIDAKKVFQGNLAVFKQLDPVEDASATHFINTIAKNRYSNCEMAILDGASLQPDKPSLSDAVKDCAQKHPLQMYYILASSKNYENFQTTFANRPNVEILLSN